MVTGAVISDLDPKSADFDFVVSGNPPTKKRAISSRIFYLREGRGSRLATGHELFRKAKFLVR